MSGKEAEDSLLEHVMVFVDTTGADMLEETEESGSKFNPGEAEVVVGAIYLVLFTLSCSLRRALVSWFCCWYLLDLRSGSVASNVCLLVRLLEVLVESTTNCVCFLLCGRA